MSFMEERKVLTREKRVSTLSHFNGTLETLIDETKGEEIKQRIRTFSQVNHDEILLAIQVLSKIEQSAVIVHGVIGCSAAGIYYEQEKSYHWYSTNLNERDTILGGDEKLRRAVLRANEETSPKVIFIVGTPVVAINNDDINSLILELEDELDVKIISIYTDGFKSKAPSTGYDIVAHSLLKYVVDRSKGEENEKEDFINLVTFSENKEDIRAVAAILRDLGISYHVLPQFSDIDTIAAAGQAKATVVLNSDEGAYFAQELEEAFHVPYIMTGAPVGLRGTRKFIIKLGKFLGIEEKAREYIERKEMEVGKEIKKSPLLGKKVFLDTKLSLAVGFVELIEKIGGTVEGLAIPYVDLQNREFLEKLESLKDATSVVIANGQPYEKANVISKKEIDYYIGNEAVSFAAEQGSIPVSLAHKPLLGYNGIREFVRLIICSSIYKGQAQNSIYKPTWLKKSSNWYVKKEVK